MPGWGVQVGQDWGGNGGEVGKAGVDGTCGRQIARKWREKGQRRQGGRRGWGAGEGVLSRILRLRLAPIPPQAKRGLMTPATGQSRVSVEGKGGRMWGGWELVTKAYTLAGTYSGLTGEGADGASCRESLHLRLASIFWEEATNGKRRESRMSNAGDSGENGRRNGVWRRWDESGIGSLRSAVQKQHVPREKCVMRFEPRIRPQAFALMLWFSVTATGVAPALSQGSSRAERRVEYDYSRGVDRSLYLPVHGEAVCDLKTCEQSAQARTVTKDKAYETAFRRIDQMGRAYTLARPHYFEGFHRLTEGKDRSILAQDIVFISAMEIYNYQHREYKYSVELGILKLPRLTPQLEADLARFLGKIEPVQDDGTVVFDIAAILAELKKDPEFLGRLRSYKDDRKFQDSIRYKDDDTQSFIGTTQGFKVLIHGYDLGQYTINSLIGSIIQGSVAPTVLRELGRRKNLIVICEGATDSLPIKRVLPYRGDGRVGVRSEEISLGVSQGRLLSSGLRNNLDLSFARGYEGARALSQILGPVLKSGRVQLVYTGIGVSASQSGSQPESRRIVYRLRLGPKLD